MKYLSTLLIVILLAAACGSDSDSGASVPPADDGSSSAEVLATAVEELITKDHTFGAGPPPFTEYLIQSSLDPAAGIVEDGTDPVVRPLTSVEREAIELVVGAYGTVQWIDDPDEFITDDLRPTVEGGVILGVGEPVIDGESGLVPVSLWCGGLCGTWFTYQLELVDEAWVVAGIDGPIAIS